MSRSTVRWGAVLALTLLSASGCFRYIPSELDALPPGQDVRVFVTRSVVEGLQEVTQFNEPVVKGRLVRHDEQELFVWVPVGERRVGFHSAQLGQDVRIPRREIIQLERREIDRLGTGALVAGGIGAAAVVLFVIMEAFGEGVGDGDCTDCPDLMNPLPIFRLPIR